jgi:hypothetical protein
MPWWPETKRRVPRNPETIRRAAQRMTLTTTEARDIAKEAFFWGMHPVAII